MEERQRKDSWKTRETPNPPKKLFLNCNQTSGVKELFWSYLDNNVIFNNNLKSHADGVFQLCSFRSCSV